MSGRLERRAQCHQRVQTWVIRTSQMSRRMMSTVATLLSTVGGAVMGGHGPVQRGLALLPRGIGDHYLPFTGAKDLVTLTHHN
jgi:hypothetical protein